jgi:hypothetical protein
MSAPAILAEAQSERLAVPRLLPVRKRDGRPLTQLSASSLQLAWRCPQKWMRRYIEGETEPKGSALVCGSVVGQSLAAYFKGQLGGVPISAADADDLLVIAFGEQTLDPLVDFGADDPPALRDQCRAALRAYLDGDEAIAPHVRPLAVERKVELRFPGAEWSVVGYLDLECEVAGVIDYKVSEKHMAQAKADRDPQATLYLLARALEGRPAPFQFHSGRRGKNPAWQRVETARTAGQLAAFQARIAQTARMLAHCAETGDWPYAAHDHWICAPKFCGFYRGCPAGGAS